jgi:hypothetical protein
MTALSAAGTDPWHQPHEWAGLCVLMRRSALCIADRIRRLNKLQLLVEREADRRSRVQGGRLTTTVSRRSVSTSCRSSTTARESPHAIEPLSSSCFLTAGLATSAEVCGHKAGHFSPLTLERCGDDRSWRQPMLRVRRNVRLVIAAFVLSWVSGCGGDDDAPSAPLDGGAGSTIPPSVSRAPRQRSATTIVAAANSASAKRRCHRTARPPVPEALAVPAAMAVPRARAELPAAARCRRAGSAKRPAAWSARRLVQRARTV